MTAAIVRAGRAVIGPWPVFVAWFYLRETWRGIPGPLWFKVLVFAAVVAEPGPYGEIAVVAFANWNGRRKARKAATA